MDGFICTALCCGINRDFLILGCEPAAAAPEAVDPVSALGLVDVQHRRRILPTRVTQVQSAVFSQQGRDGLEEGQQQPCVVGAASGHDIVEPAVLRTQPVC